MANSPALAAGFAHIEELTRQGRFAEAELACAALVEQHPAVHEAWAWLGVMRLVGQKFAEAEAALRQAIGLFGSEGRYWANATLALRGQSKLAEAEGCARQAVALDPGNGAYWAALAGVLFELSKYAESAQAYREALARDPANAIAWADLGAAEHALGNALSARQALEHSVSLAPGNADTLTKYAMLLIETGEARQGVALLQPVVQQAPQSPLAWLALGRAHRMLDDLPQAEAAFRRAVQLVPQNREARHDLVLVLLARFNHVEAEAVIRQLVADEPSFAAAWLLLGVVLHMQARVEEALPALRRAAELAPTPIHYSKMLVSLPYADATTAEQLLAEHVAWDVAFARPLSHRPPPAPVRRDDAAPLRLGLVACDFAAGPTGFLALRAIESLDKSQCTVICYSDRLREDEYTARYRAASDLWRPTIGTSDEQLAQQIQADEIDVLFDLSGHIGARLLVFARRPAPLQITWLGYVGTTGMQAMDGLLADRYHVRPGEEPWYAERILQMPNAYACYGPPRRSPPVEPLPATRRGQLTFGCFNNPVKFTPRLLDTWAAILAQVPTSQLLLKYFGLDQPHLQAWIRGQFASRGVAGERIELEGWSPHAQLLSAYGRVDLALDSQPYSGGLTTCEALWMGVPVITYPGRTFAGRHATSYLSNAGCEQFVAADRASYIELAVDWARRWEELAAIRAGLREQLRQSAVCDAPRFAADLLSVVRQCWSQRAAR